MIRRASDDRERRLRSDVTWREYQEQTAEVFRSFGFNTSVEEVLHGARSAHAIDVVVRFHSHGLNHLWICECKHWTRPVPQEKVDSLVSVADDVGAHHGICFAEAGFQAGAFRVASNRNITLTSLSDFRSGATEEMLNAELKAVSARALHCSQALDDWVESTFPGMEDRVAFLFGACPIGSLSTAARSLVDTIGRAITVGYPQLVGTVPVCEEHDRVFERLWGVYYTLGSVEVSSAGELLDTAAALVSVSEAVSQHLHAGRVPHPDD